MMYGSTHQQQALQLSLSLSQLEVVLDERADLAGAEDGDDQAGQKQGALNERRVLDPENVEVEDSQGEVHDDGELHLELVHLQVLQDLMGERMAAGEWREFPQ